MAPVSADVVLLGGDDSGPAPALGFLAGNVPSGQSRHQEKPAACARAAVSPACASSPVSAHATSATPPISAEEAALLAMIDVATKQGTSVVSVTGPSGVQRDIRIHGSQPEDLEQLRSALVAMRERDPHDILLRDLKDIYVMDSIDGANGLAWRRGPCDTPIFLLRRNCNQLADPDQPFLHVLYHEIAHVIDDAHDVSKPAPVRFGRGDDPDDYISRYAYNTNDCREDFAESFAAFWRYRTDPRFEGQDDASVVGAIMNMDRRKSVRVWNKLEAVPEAIPEEV